ncbi:acyltransferase [Dyadobacter sp. 676]|uniref:Acyltransferase n=1 Tax=Dyadobacter sp. 676 TaxID=3088362 RepID=A0AAU8FM61_9BACT
MMKKICVGILIALASGIAHPGAADGLKAAGRTFAVTPRPGTPAGHTKTGNKIEVVHGDLKTTIILLEEGPDRLCFLTSALTVESGLVHNACVNILSQVFRIPPEAVVTASSHNHTIPWMHVDSAAVPETGSPQMLNYELGQDFLKKLRKAAVQMAGSLEPVTVEWGMAEENRITYNRRGRRPNGKTYFMREEDRMLVGEGYRGLIDPEAMVVVFKNRSDRPVAAFSFFTGHPVAAYNPEKMMSYGQFPQVASEILSEYLGGAPVAFVQGCGGDINAKHMLTGTIAQARLLGEQLGETFVIAAKSLRKSKRSGLEWSREPVYIPLAPLPDEASLRRDLESIDDFVKRGDAGDENTYECVGMNFPKALTPPYRARLVQSVRPWYVWALDQHKTRNLRNVPTELPISIVVARFGDVGFVGLPYEPFVKTGLKIKQEAALPCVLTGGYTDGSYGYIPDATACDDPATSVTAATYRLIRPRAAMPARWWLLTNSPSLPGDRRRNRREGFHKDLRSGFTVGPQNANEMQNVPEMRNCRIGPDAGIEPNVMLGYRYPGWRKPLVIGAGVRVHSGTVIYADTVIGDHFTCGHNVLIRAECEIGDRVVILHGTTLEGRLRIGKGVKIMAHVYIPSRTVIGNMVFVGPGVNFLNAMMPMRGPEVTGAIIGNHAVIGGGVTIGPGVTIGDNVFVGAGAVVMSDIPPDSLAYGVPASYRPLPEKFGKGNDPRQIFEGADLWDNRPGDGSWQEEDWPGKRLF